MPLKTRHGQSIDPLPGALRTIGELAAAIAALQERGDIEGLNKVFDDFCAATEIQQDAFSTIISKANKRSEQLRKEFGHEIRELTRAVNCACDIKLPYVTIGCVKLHEKSQGRWELSVLDSEAITSFRAKLAEDLVENALEQIKAIEVALGKVDEFVRDLRKAYVFAKSDKVDRVSANLLMLLTSYGRNLKKYLSSSGDLIGGGGFSRAQFGFLLSAAHRAVPRDSIIMHGATQNDNKPEKYVSVPKSVDPRELCEYRRITSLTIS